MASPGGSSKTTVQLPSPLSDATGPPTGSQLHQGPTMRTLVTVSWLPLPSASTP